MSVYVLLEYVQECKKYGKSPNRKGLYDFKKKWRD